MTKTQIINTLNNKYESVAGESDWDNKGSFLDYDLIRIPVMDSKDEAKWSTDVYVWKKGVDYYWRNGEPKGKGYQYKEALEGYITDKRADGTIAAGIIEKVDPIHETAVVTIYIDNNGIQEKKFLIDKDTKGDVRKRLIS